ncbi:MAG: SUMF1/EgtB/PvdO family nonheme iron enzyme [Bacteroidales bacterium]|nr:SUMF1/EgtB/PvdO family nonheme iron enzyme [Bacteroidales bacterium]
MKTMKKTKLGGFLLAIVMAVLLNTNANASNIQITTEPTIEVAMPGLKVVKFSLSWEYSWRSAQLNNWDGAWVFVKYRIGMDSWDHMYLDHSYNPGTDLNANGVPMAFTYGFTGQGDQEKAVGVFLYRQGNGQGDINWQNLSVRWRYDTENTYVSRPQLYTDDDVIVRVFAIEMVYVPEGVYFLGDGANKNGNFCKADELDHIILPFQVRSEASIGFGLRPDEEDGLMDVAGMLSVVGSNVAQEGSGLGPTDPLALSALYPKGFQAFWIMKYEVTQSAYTDFLNTLTTAQQTNRIRVDGNSGVDVWVMRAPGVVDRNSIRIKTPGVIEFAMDATPGAGYDQDDDGRGVPCAMGKDDLLAYLDWSGLRPMTELEYEKACRGPIGAVPGEFPWGNTFQIGASAPATHLINRNLPNEAITLPDGVNHNNLGANDADRMALITRNGAFATPNSDRIKAGATYWGIMEMGSNMAEPVINVNTEEGRRFTGRHGDGRLAVDGTANVQLWPTTYAGLGHRGGNVANGLATGGGGLQTTSSREVAENTWPHRYWTGGRGVRTATGSNAW